MKKNKISALAKQYGVVLGFVLLICIGALLSETFLSAQNLINILKQYAPIVVISCGTTLVIISGQIDLGAGSGPMDHAFDLKPEYRQEAGK